MRFDEARRSKRQAREGGDAQLHAKYQLADGRADGEGSRL